MVIPLDAYMSGDPLNCTGFLLATMVNRSSLMSWVSLIFPPLMASRVDLQTMRGTIRGNRLCEVMALGGLNSDQFTSEVGGDSSGCDREK
ncbi:hypothetical protein TNCV_2461211 [Trichonephila clavipes]|nr:hypothetical protein TNCV_2461211 [Trichonephila clavipes]